MVIDAHNHLGGPDKGDGRSQSPEEILAVMDEAGIDRAVVFPFDEAEPGVSFSRCNDYIASASAGYPDRLIGFCRLDPNAGHNAVSELERCIGALGLRGVKLHPSSQNFTLDNPVLAEILDAAQELRVPVVFDTGKKMSPPSGVAALAASRPRLAVIMAHMNLFDESVEAARNNPNVFLGTTGYFNIKRLGLAIRELGAKKIIAGSDSPYIKMQSEISKFDKVEGLTDDERRCLLGENFVSALDYGTRF